jgi:hypothetical protein
MRPFDDMPPESDDYADVALLVAGVREFPSDEFAHELDARVARRFAPGPARTMHRPRRLRLLRWTAGPAVAVVAAAAVAVVVLSGGSSPRPALNGASLASKPTAKTPGVFHAVTNAAAGSSAIGQPPSAYSNATAVPAAPGAKQIQSAQISLSTPNAHVDQVSQEVFNVVALERGTVQSSQITAASRNSGGGYASFKLSIPTGNLQAAMTQLSRLHYAAVSSRTDASQNVSNQYANDRRQLTDAQALRTSLLKQLETADTETAVDSIKAQLKLVENQISGDQSTLNSLQHRISYSTVSVQINSGGLPFTPVARSGGFTIHRAVHDAGRVLVVSAGVALITLAVLLPVGMVAALLMWLWVWLRQRRREHALDAVE